MYRCVFADVFFLPWTLHPRLDSGSATEHIFYSNLFILPFQKPHGTSPYWSPEDESCFIEPHEGLASYRWQWRRSLRGGLRGAAPSETLKVRYTRAYVFAWGRKIDQFLAVQCRSRSKTPRHGGMARIMDGSEYEAGWPQRFNRDGVYHSDMSLNTRLYIWCIVFGMCSARRLSHLAARRHRIKRRRMDWGVMAEVLHSGWVFSAGVKQNLRQGAGVFHRC